MSVYFLQWWIRCCWCWWWSLWFVIRNFTTILNGVEKKLNRQTILVKIIRSTNLECYQACICIPNDFNRTFVAFYWITNHTNNIKTIWTCRMFTELLYFVVVVVFNVEKNHPNQFRTFVVSFKLLLLTTVAIILSIMLAFNSTKLMKKKHWFNSIYSVYANTSNFYKLVNILID